MVYQREEVIEKEKPTEAKPVADYVPASIPGENTGYDIPPPQWVPGTKVPKDTAVKDMTESEYAQYMYENLTPFWAIRANLIYQHDPVISSLEPTTAAIGDPSFRLVVTGETFTNESVIVFAGHDENTQLNDDGTLSTGVNMAFWHGPDTIPVMVRNGSMYSEPADFTFTAAAGEAVRDTNGDDDDDDDGDEPLKKSTPKAKKKK